MIFLYALSFVSVDLKQCPSKGCSVYLERASFGYPFHHCRDMGIALWLVAGHLNSFL